MCHEASGRALQAALGTGQGHGRPQGLGDRRRPVHPRRQRRLERTADADRALGRVSPRRADRPHQPAGRGGRPAHDRSARVRRHGAVQVDADQHPEPPGPAGRRPGAAARHRESRTRGGGTDPKALDEVFIERHTDGFEEYQKLCEATRGQELERQSGLSEADIRNAAEIYSRSERTLISWCLGLTQHEHGVDTVREIVNLLLLRGNLGREGAGPSPVRGHSNVQGNRTCGIDHRPTTGVPRPARRRLRHRPAARARPRHGPHHRRDDRRIGQGLRRDGRQLRARRARHRGYTADGTAALRADRAGQHEAEPQPPRARPEGADPAVPGADRAGPAAPDRSRPRSRTR